MGNFANGFLPDVEIQFKVGPLHEWVSSKSFQFRLDIKDPKFLSKTFQCFSGHSWIVDHAILNVLVTKKIQSLFNFAQTSKIKIPFKHFSVFFLVLKNKSKFKVISILPRHQRSKIPFKKFSVFFLVFMIGSTDLWLNSPEPFIRRNVN